MIRRILGTAGFVAVMVALVLGITSLSPAALPRVTKVTPPQENKSVCLPTEGEGIVFAADADTTGELGGSMRATTGATLLTGQTEPVVLTGSGSPVGGYLNSVGVTRSWTPCSPALAQGLLIVPSAQNTELLIVNSDRSDAAVDLTIQGPDGDIEALGARGIAVASNSSRVIALSVLADVEGPVSVGYRASRGRATIIARTQTAAGLDSASMSTPATEHLLAGIPAGAGNATVLLANPTDRRVTVDITAFGATANYTPEGGSDVSVAARSTLAVPLGASLAGEATALRVTSEAEIGAALVTGAVALDPQGPLDAEQAFVAPGVEASVLSAFVHAGGVLQLSSTSQEAQATVTITVGGVVTETPLVVPGGGTVTLPLSADAPQGRVVTVTSDVEVFGAVAFLDGSGVAVAPLEDSGVVVAEPLAAELDPMLN